LEISMGWDGGLKFGGISQFGREISVDSVRKVGGNEDGYMPMELVLFALAGCTGIDVICIAKKMRQEVNKLKINIRAEQRDEHPRSFTKAHIEYIFTGKNLEPGKVEKMISLSEDRYCSVSASMSGNVEITSSYRIVEE
jgi:putative redox protein